MNSNIDHMIEVLGWIRDNKPFQASFDAGKIWEPVHFFDALGVVREIQNNRYTYRLKPTPVRRPFTPKEAQRLVGCVLVSPDGKHSQCPIIYEEGAFYRYGPNPSFASLANDGWHYHLPGHPDDLKPCWMEEAK